MPSRSEIATTIIEHLKTVSECDRSVVAQWLSYHFDRDGKRLFRSSHSLPVLVARPTKVETLSIVSRDSASPDPVKERYKQVASKSRSVQKFDRASRFISDVRDNRSSELNHILPKGSDFD